MTEGFPQMRYEVLEDDETICLTDCEVAAATTFGTRVKKMMENSQSLEPLEREIEFRDHNENKFILLKYQLGLINDLNS